MQSINPLLKEYIEKKIFPEYDKNESGHNIKHIKFVIERSLKFAQQFNNINLDIVYTVAAFHDLAHHIDKDRHDVLSAKMFFENETMKEFFNDEERVLIKEAIEDHRSCNPNIPRSIYGKIVSSADRTISMKKVLERTHSYSMKHSPNTSLEEMSNRAYEYVTQKYGPDGYAKFYVEDEEYTNFLKEVSTFIKDKDYFIEEYKKANNIDDAYCIKDKAKFFAINAHKGQVRKNEPEKPMVIHPIAVAKILEEYEAEANVVAAGYLHDVVEDTKYTIDDIRNEFGDDIANLVATATEPDKSLSWEERKEHTITQTKNIPLRNKLIICADKIQNLEDLLIKFQKTGVRDFSLFKRDEEKQKWYYTSIYNSLTQNVDPSLPIFQRLHELIECVFQNKENDFLKNTIFESDLEYYDSLKKLHAQKLELKKLHQFCSLNKPFVIEFSGTPRTGKTTVLNNICDFLNKGKFNVKLINEFTTSQYYKEHFFPERKNWSSSDLNISILEEVARQLTDNVVGEEYDIILIDRSINDRAIWNYRRLVKGDMTQEVYETNTAKYSDISKKFIDALVVFYTDSLTCLKRDYTNTLALEDRKFINMQNIDEYNNALLSSEDVFEKSVDKYIKIDTTTVSPRDVAVQVMNELLPIVRDKYVKQLNQIYN